LNWLFAGEGSANALELSNEAGRMPEVSAEMKPVIDAVIEVMLSDDEGVKLALSQNAFTFQQSVRWKREVDELRNDMEIIKKRLLDPREADFKTQGTPGEDQHLGKHRVGGKNSE
jgi:hypothetical protein